jgi:hypothetical protein
MCDSKKIEYLDKIITDSGVLQTGIGELRAMVKILPYLIRGVSDSNRQGIIGIPGIRNFDDNAKGCLC